MLTLWPVFGSQLFKKPRDWYLRLWGGLTEIRAHSWAKTLHLAASVCDAAYFLRTRTSLCRKYKHPLVVFFFFKLTFIVWFIRRRRSVRRGVVDGGGRPHLRVFVRCYWLERQGTRPWTPSPPAAAPEGRHERRWRRQFRRRDVRRLVRLCFGGGGRRKGRHSDG